MVHVLNFFSKYAVLTCFMYACESEDSEVKNELSRIGDNENITKAIK